jgi:ubiquinone/menaquinone biosynthesis C-methylase UbiE
MKLTFTGREGARLLGYDLSSSSDIPESAIASFCGVGSPFTSGEIMEGDSVLDVGCGGGLDLIIAAQMAGPHGAAVGIDLVPEIVENARKNVESAGLVNSQVKESGSESLPFQDSEFDIVISNGALYLSPLKEKTLREIYRVLKPGGRLQFADVVLKDDLPESITRFFDGWSG